MALEPNGHRTMRLRPVSPIRVSNPLDNFFEPGGKRPYSPFFSLPTLEAAFRRTETFSSPILSCAIFAMHVATPNKVSAPMKATTRLLTDHASNYTSTFSYGAGRMPVSLGQESREWPRGYERASTAVSLNPGQELARASVSNTTARLIIVL